MRGKRVPRPARQKPHGITPADAGKTSWARIFMQSLSDHPRGCGENTARLRGRGFRSGSPPRMRGKRRRRHRASSAQRITPADAGKTSKIEHISLSVQDHPRGCGENRTEFATGAVRDRITPADAGKTAVKPPLILGIGDHPRGCGENVHPANSCTSTRGSPPRMRGKLGQCGRSVADAGITPADAGKTSMKYCRWKEEQDHPRGCGENYLAAFQAVREQGSPPRMRGKLCRLHVGTLAHRITPADAGKTTCSVYICAGEKDHPRGCGENQRVRPFPRRLGGSPPRMRGKLASA